MDKLTEIKQVWDSVYTEHGTDVPWVKKESLSVNFILDLVSKTNLQPKSMLDYAAGTGHIAAAIQEKLNIPNVVAADITKNPVDEKLLEQHEIKFIEASAPKDVGGKYDLILCWTLFNHLPPEMCKEFLAQFADMLNKNGALIMSAFSRQNRWFDVRKIFRFSGLPMYPENISENQALYEKLGLKMILKEDAEYAPPGKKLNLLRVCVLKKQTEKELI